jgi:rhamnogalacturonan hydrolase
MYTMSKSLIGRPFSTLTYPQLLTELQSDECICVKSPSKQATIENIRCNQSGGSTIGSLKDGSVIENILFQNIENYQVRSNSGPYFTHVLTENQVTNAFMLKTYPGGASPGYVKNVVLRNFTNIDVTCKSIQPEITSKLITCLIYRQRVYHSILAE